MKDKQIITVIDINQFKTFSAESPILGHKGAPSYEPTCTNLHYLKWVEQILFLCTKLTDQIEGKE